MNNRIQNLLDMLAETLNASKPVPIGEPGYKGAVVIAEWHRLTAVRRMAIHRNLGRHGYVAGYPDEWTCLEGRAYRTASPDDHTFAPAFIISVDGEVTLKSTIREDAAVAADYITSLVNDPDAYDSVGVSTHLTNLGFTRDDNPHRVGYLYPDALSAQYATYREQGLDVVKQLAKAPHIGVTRVFLWTRQPCTQQPDAVPTCDTTDHTWATYTVLPDGMGQFALLRDGVEVYVAYTYTECFEHAITLVNNTD